MNKMMKLLPLLALALISCTVDTNEVPVVQEETAQQEQEAKKPPSQSCNPNPQVYTAGSYWSMTSTNNCDSNGRTTSIVYGGTTWLPTPSGSCYCHLQQAGNPTYCNTSVGPSQFVRWECNSTP